MFRYFVSLFLFLILVQGEPRWHTSQIALAKLYNLQKLHFSTINDYLDLEMKRLEELKNILASVHEWRGRITTDNVTSYLHNHVNGIQTMNRIHRQIRKIEDLTNNGHSMAVLNAIDGDSGLSEDDIFLSAQGLRRIQRFYDIPASEMAAGRFVDRVIGDEMNACECYVIANNCFENHDMGGALDWGVQAYEKWMNSNYPKCVDIERLDFYIVVSSVYVGFDYRTLYDQNYIYPKNTKNLVQYLTLMRAEINPHEGKTMDIIDSYQSPHFDGAQAKFKALCKRGKPFRSSTKDLQCRYQIRNSSYRILMPFKEEDINSNPYIKLYHDVLYDDEIQHIKTIVTENMVDAKVSVGAGKSNLKELSRSCQANWIYNDEQFQLLNDRIKCLTGMSMESAEMYQIVNYGLGGHYVPHHDAFHKTSVDKTKGNRIMTVLFYMTDVPNDGYTAFPMLDVIVPVEKGSAVVWYGLHTNNGSIYIESLHGSCPLLKGNKWIMTKWLYEGGQFLSYDWRKNYE